MYCHSCGIALTQQMKFCNRCGALLIKPDSTADLKRTEKRLDSYLEGLFWVTVIGLAFIFGGLIVLKQVGFERWVLITYVVLSSTAFLINFGISLWGALKIMKGAKEIPEPREPQTKELEAGNEILLTPGQTPASITENTTRSFEPVLNKRSEYDN
jgi:hypothetical protein